MAKRNTIKVDVEKMFLPRSVMDSPDARKRAMQSPLWPIFIAAYSATNGSVRVAGFTSPLNEDDDPEDEIALTTPHGFPVASAIYNPDAEDGNAKFVISSSSDIFNTNKFGHQHMILATNSQRYAVQKINRGPHDVRTAICNLAMNVMPVIGHRLRHIVDSTVDGAFGESVSTRPYLQIPGNYGRSVMKVFVGEWEKNEVPHETMMALESLYKQYREKEGRFDNAIERARTLFQGEKILFFPKVSNGLVIGKMDTTPVMAAIDSYDKKGSLPNDNTYVADVHFTMPLTWYPSIDALPSDMRQHLEIQLVLLKAHTGADDLIQKLSALGQKNGTNRFNWPDLGAAGYAGHSMNSDLLVLNA